MVMSKTARQAASIGRGRFSPCLWIALEDGGVELGRCLVAPTHPGARHDETPGKAASAGRAAPEEPRRRGTLPRLRTPRRHAARRPGASGMEVRRG